MLSEPLNSYSESMYLGFTVPLQASLHLSVGAFLPAGFLLRSSEAARNPLFSHPGDPKN
jgi:hypothetical protein